MEDDEIRGAIRRGDDNRAFTLLMREHGPALYGRCLRILRNREAAEDVMQQTLISVFKSRAQLLEVTQLRAWLLRAATNKCFDALRASRRSVRLQSDWPGADAADSEMLGNLIAVQERRALEGCLARLEPEVAAAVLMRFRDGRSWDEIAAAVDVAVDTIRMRVQRGALKSLKECLASHEVTS